MPFNVRKSTDAATATDRWSKGVQGSGAKLASGYANPRRDPKSAALAASDRWLQAVTAAQPQFNAGVNRYDADMAINTMNTVGQSRYTQAGVAKKDNYGSIAGPLLAAIAANTSALPADRSTPEAREARMIANVRGLRELRGQFRKK